MSSVAKDIDTTKEGASSEPAPIQDAFEFQPFSADEFATAARVVEAIGSEFARSDDKSSSFYKAKACRPLRKALTHLLDDLRSQFPRDPDKYHRKKRLKTQKQAERQRLIAQDREYINKTKLRAERIAALKELQAQGSNLPMIPDGPAGASSSTGTTLGMIKNDTKVAESEDGDATKRLNRLRSCYTCKKRYQELHPFYDQLCPACASLNMNKRDQTADLTGRVCLVTGARVKIGFQVALKLLRAGATVIATTRFPNEAAVRYSREKDFGEWSDRLRIMAMDFRNLGGVHALAAFITSRYDRLDVLINNACQTIRRPPAYYAHLMNIERCPVKKLGDDARVHKVLSQHEAFLSSQPTLLQLGDDAARTVKRLEDARGESEASSSAENHAPAPPTSTVAQMSQVPLMDSDKAQDPTSFPAQTYDINRQQLDLRSTNSWLLKLDEVELPELVEVFSINAIAPFVLNSKLKPLLERASSPGDKYVINVSAMEGKFYRHKTANHPHTNMAKAALNMLTRTSAADYAKSGIYMNSVDTGWINDENPLERAANTAAKHNFQTPIDEVDAAARILDPVFMGIAGTSRPFGKFYKDYKETEW